MTKIRFLVLVLLFSAAAGFFTPRLEAQTGRQNLDRRGGHRGAVSALVIDDEGRIISSGEDGFIEIWDRQKNAAAERFQIGVYPITDMALRPGRPELAFVETNNAGLSRVSVWDYEKKQNLFTLPFNSRTDRVFYSAGGSFLLITGNSGVERVQSETGASLPVPELSGTVSFAATGRSQRSMVAYLNTGYLSYWDLETGMATGTVYVPRDIKSPLLLGNNRYFAGFDAEGLFVLDAVSGTILLRENGIRSGILFTGNPEGTEFLCLVPGMEGQLARNPSVLHHFNIKLPASRLESLNRRNIPGNMPLVNSGVIINEEMAALGTIDGRVLTINRNGTARLMDTLNQLRIEEAAASADALAFITENNRLGFIPLDYTRINSRTSIRFENCEPYTSIAAGESDFLLWQSQNTRSFPLIKHLSAAPERGSVSETYINKLTLRFPLRSVSVYGDLYLFMDSIGNITILNQETGTIIFTYTSQGAQDAVFVNETAILIGRSANQNSSAFLMVNIITGETVPFPVSAALGAKVYRGPSGQLYGSAVSSSFRTSLVTMNAANPGRTEILAEIDTENPVFSMAESGTFLAANPGMDKARLFSIMDLFSEETALERSPGLPLVLAGAGDLIICADTDGNICWYDPLTGGILAILRLYTNTWVLEKEGVIISGNVQGY